MNVAFCLKVPAFFCRIGNLGQIVCICSFCTKKNKKNVKKEGCRPADVARKK